MNPNTHQQLQNITNQLHEIHQQLQNITNQHQPTHPGLQTPKQPPHTQKPTNKAKSQPTHNLGPTPNTNNPHWPQAVNPTMIITENNEPERKYRAQQITATLNHNHTNQNTLDYGCGEGHIAHQLAKKTHHTTAYDPTPSPYWTKLQQPNLTYTTNKQDIQKNAPYDYILLYDVLDHLTEDPTQTLQQLAQHLTPNGTIHIKTHPWTSKHGGHTYQQLNKAYAHLILTPDELAQQGITPPHNQKITRPQQTYEKIIQDAQLTIQNKKIHTTPLDPYITTHYLDRIIKTTWNGKIDPQQAQKILQITFIDYTLQHPQNNP